jgi:hypothetical protein
MKTINEEEGLPVQILTRGPSKYKTGILRTRTQQLILYTKYNWYKLNVVTDICRTVVVEVETACVHGSVTTAGAVIKREMDAADRVWGARAGRRERLYRHVWQLNEPSAAPCPTGNVCKCVHLGTDPAARKRNRKCIKLYAQRYNYDAFASVWPLNFVNGRRSPPGWGFLNRSLRSAEKRVGLHVKYMSMSNFTKIFSALLELLHTYRRTDKTILIGALQGCTRA